MSLRPTPIALAVCLLAIHGAAVAQQPAENKETPAKPVAKVEVKGKAEEYDARREDTASKTVLLNEEIMKYGDTTVFDVLKRAPGVTVTGNSIRMRGLGNGYTQILVNGERPPPGFSMETLPPDQIEKIEVIRAATAEHSMQAIAGTINIVLKKVVSKAQRDLRVNGNYSGQQKSMFVNGLLADRSGNLSWYLNGNMGRNLSSTSNEGRDQFTAPSGQVVQLRDSTGQFRNHNRHVGVAPRLNWKLENEDQLNVSAFVHTSHYGHDSDSNTINRIGAFPQPDYTGRGSVGTGSSRFGGGDVNWVAKLGGGKLDAKLSGSRGRAQSAQQRISTTADRSTVLLRDSSISSNFDNASSTGKFTKSIFDGHALATGWEASRQGTEDDTLRVEGLAGRAPVRIAEQFTPVVTKMAAYVQDEWTITRQWSLYQGVRWESIRTDSAGTGLQTTQSRSHVLSPVAQTLYKFPDKSGRQLRLALTRTFKAPANNQLSARRFESELNTRFNPDFSGNPDLKPELATGIDLTYEHFLFPGAVFSTMVSQRRISDYIRSKLAQDSRGYWLFQPLNDGNAQVRTLEVEWKFPLKAFMADAPGFDFRANLNRNWSKVDSVPGPDNRLDQQVKFSSVLGVDYREDKYSAGASLSYRSGGPVRISEQQTNILQAKRELEAYWLYKVRTGLQVRLSVANALGEDTLGDSRYVDLNGASQTWTRTPSSARFGANVEMKF